MVNPTVIDLTVEESDMKIAQVRLKRYQMGMNAGIKKT